MDEMAAVGLLLRLGEQFAADGDWGRFFDELLEIALKVADTELGSLQLVDAEMGDLRIVTARGLPSEWLSYWERVAKGHGACGAALELKHPIFVEDIEKSALFVGTPGLEMQRRAGVRAVLSTPLVSHRREPLGMVSVHYREPRRPEPRVFAMLEMLARHAADIVARHRSEAALRESESRLRALVQASSDVVYRMSPDWSEIRYRVGRQLFHDTSTPVHGWLDKSIPPDEHERVQRAIQQAIESRNVFELEHRSIRDDGSIGWNFSRAVPILDDQGEVREWFGMTSDVTRRKSAEEAQAADLAALRQMHEISTRDVRLTGVNGLLQDVLDAAIAILHAEQGTLQLVEQQDGLRVAAHRGHSDEFLRYFASLENVQTACAEVTRTGARVLIEDVECHPLLGEAEALRLLHAGRVRSLQATPLFTRDRRLIGILTTHWSTPHRPNAEDLCRLDLLVRQAADLIDRAQAEDLLRQSEERLRLALSAGGLAAWETNLATGTVSWDVWLAELLGVTESQLGNSHQQWMNLVHPEDRPRLEREIAAACQPGMRPFDSEFRVLTPPGELRWYHAHGKLASPHVGGPILRGVVREITARKVAELELQQLKESLEQRVVEQTNQVRMLARAMEQLAEGVVVVDEANAAEAEICFVNAALCRITGYTAAELQGKPPSIFANIMTNSPKTERVRHDLELSGQFREEFIGLRKDGSEYDAEVQIAAIKDDAGRWTHSVAIHRDITERNRVHRAIRDREQRLSAVLESAFHAIITIDNDGRITSANAATERLFGYSQAEMLGQNVKMLMPSPYRDEHDDYLRRYVATGVARVIGSNRIVMGQRKDGTVFPMDLSVSKLNQHGFSGAVRDLSELHALQRSVIEIASEEQRRIGQDLHDGIQQELTGMSLIASTIVDVLREVRTQTSNSARASVDLKRLGDADSLSRRLVEGMSEAIRHVQSLARGLQPVHVEPQGLQAALLDLTRDSTIDKVVECHFHGGDDVLIADATTATQLYRIAQEAITNAIKHGQATRIDVTLRKMGNQIQLEVVDNGVGVDPAAIIRRPTRAGGGMGLRIMEHRANLISGTIMLRPGIPGGSILCCTIEKGGGPRDDSRAAKTHTARR